MSRDKALETILQLRREYEDNSSKIHKANEAKTRLLIIDRVLDSLGWSPKDFNPETNSNLGSYIDYLLEADDVPRLIVEAKRVGVTFASPSKRSKRNHYQLRYFRSAFGQDFAVVLDQARRYAVETAVPFAVLTNGAEWLLVQLLAGPGVGEINDLQGIYFGNLFSDDFNFDLLWEVLCKDYVSNGSLEANLGSQNLKEADFCMVSQVALHQLSWQPTRDNDQLWQFYDLFFDEIIDPGRRSMLEKCFVSNSKLDHFQAELQRALRDTAPTYLGDTETVDELAPGEGNRLIATQSGDRKGRVVIITGSVGCGKSTFVTRVLVDVKKDKREDLLALKIDLIDEPIQDPSLVTASLWEYATQEWNRLVPKAYELDMLRKIFGRQLLELKQGPFREVIVQNEAFSLQKEAELLDMLVSKPETYFKDAWRYYQQKGHGIIVFLDNVDRASESYQQQVYSFAHKVARETGATVIVTMREFTFFRGRDAGFLDVRTDDIVFHLQSPNLLQLLSKRVRYVEEYIDEDHRLSKLRATRDWNAFYEFALRQCVLLKQTFLKGENEGSAILAILSSVAWHDVRYFLKILRHVHFRVGADDRQWRLSESLAALLASSESGTPYLGNLYIPPFPSFKCYFLRLRIVLLLQYGRVHQSIKRGTGFGEVHDLLKQYGYQRRWIEKALEELVQERFLECLEAPAAEDFTKTYKLSPKHTFRPSPLAVVCIEEGIINDPIYLSLVGGTIPFHDKNRLAQFEQIVGEFCDLLDDKQLTRDAVQILTETRAANVVANYLTEMYGYETPLENIAAHIPEVAAIEQRLSDLVSDLNQHVTIIPRQNNMRNSPNQQLFLFQQPEQMSDEKAVSDVLPMPHAISGTRVGRSELAPLIYWALVYIRLQGYGPATGMEITDIINRYLVEEGDQKAPNNVSRALRSDLLRSQEWLVVRKMAPRNTRFSVVDNWKDYWEPIFGCDLSSN